MQELVKYGRAWFVRDDKSRCCIRQSVHQVDLQVLIFVFCCFLCLFTTNIDSLSHFETLKTRIMLYHII